MRLAVKQLGLVACVALSVLAAGTGVASAAGKPTSVEISNTHELAGYTVMELTAKVNPNGASTSTTIEFREEGTTTWAKGLTHNLSGITVRSYTEELQVTPVKNYEARVKATNLYGTTESVIAHGVSTRIRTTGEKELTNVPYGSSGIASFAFVYANTPINVVCNETDSGYIGNVSGKGDIYKYTMSGCIVYLNGKRSTECTVSRFTFVLSGPT